MQVRCATMTDTKLVKVLHLITSQGLGESIIFRIEHVSELLDAPIEEVYDDINQGRIHCKKLGGQRSHWRMTTSELLKYIAYRKGDS